MGLFANDGVMNDAHLITKVENAVARSSRVIVRNLPGSSAPLLIENDQYDARNVLQRDRGQRSSLWLYHGWEDRDNRDRLQPRFIWGPVGNRFILQM